MKKIVLFLLLMANVAFSQENTSTVKAGKYQMNIPPLGVKKDSAVVWDGASKLLKILPISTIAPVTNLDFLATPTGGTIFSSTGNDALVPLATTTNAGLQSPADKAKINGLDASLANKVDKVAGKGLSTEDYTTVEKNKLAGIANNATANQTDAYLLDRQNHTNQQPINTVIGLQAAIDAKLNLSLVGANNGVTPLDAGGKVSFQYLPSSLMIYKKMWDVSTNTPVLSDATGVVGWVYKVSVGGTINLGSGNLTFLVGDYVIHNGTNWERSPGTDAVVSVNGQQGVVTLNTSHIPDSANKRYQTDAQQANNDATSSIQNQLNSKEPSFSKNTAFNKNFGTSVGTVAQGDDSRINNGQTAFTWGNHSGLYAPIIGSTNYIQNQNSAAQTANIWVNGDVKSNGKLTWGSGSYAAGDGQIFNTPTAGTQLIGKTGSIYDFQLVNGSGLGVFGVPTGTRGITVDGAVTAPTFNGNATTATKWITPRNFTIGNATKSVDGSSNIGWSHAEIDMPTRAGIGASGTWGISITGNANAANFANLWNGLSYNNSSPTTSPLYFMGSVDGGTYGYTPLANAKASLNISDGSTLSNSINGNANSATNWGGRPADLNTINNTITYFLVRNPDATTRLADVGGAQATLGLNNNSTLSNSINGSASNLSGSINGGGGAADANSIRINDTRYYATAANTPEAYFQAITLGNGTDSSQFGIGSSGTFYKRWGQSPWKAVWDTANFNPNNYLPVGGNAVSATTASIWGARTANLAADATSIHKPVVVESSGVVTMATNASFNAWLGLGANAFTSTAYLALSGGIVSGKTQIVKSSTIPSLGVDGGGFNLLDDFGKYGLFTGILNSGNIFFQSQRNDGLTNAYNLLFQPSGGNVILGGTSDNGNKFQVTGNASFSGTVIAGGFFNATSDIRLKNVIARNGDLIYFNWKDKRDTLTHIGYSAQEVQETHPDQVNTDDKGMLSVSYTEILVEKVRRLEQVLEYQEKRIKQLENRK